MDKMVCPTCRQLVRVRKDGKLGLHTRPVEPPFTWPRRVGCWAGGVLPSEAGLRARAQLGTLTAADQRELAKRESIEEAKAASDIDGYGDEGAGYDYRIFAEQLEASGWVYQPGGAK